jgi:hypothetical protein
MNLNIYEANFPLEKFSTPAPPIQDSCLSSCMYWKNQAQHPIAAKACNAGGDVKKIEIDDLD